MRRCGKAHQGGVLRIWRCAGREGACRWEKEESRVRRVAREVRVSTQPWGGASAGMPSYLGKDCGHSEKPSWGSGKLAPGCE